MTILVTGSTGTIGSEVLKNLVGKNVDVRALVRDATKADFPRGVTAVQGDMTDVESTRAALDGVSTLFLLNAVVPDELTQALVMLNLAHEAGIQRVVYWSVLHSDIYTNVPHLASKFAVERMIEEFGIPATILRPSAFMQNDARLKEALLGPGIYPMPIGHVGVSMVDTRDMGEVAALHLVRRERAESSLPTEIVNLVGPDALTGASIAAIWSNVLDRPIRYGGDDLRALEQQMRGRAPSWMAYDMGLMMGRFQLDGILGKPGNVDALTALLDRPLRTYQEFALEAAEQWRRG